MCSNICLLGSARTAGLSERRTRIHQVCESQDSFVSTQHHLEDTLQITERHAAKLCSQAFDQAALCRLHASWPSRSSNVLWATRGAAVSAAGGVSRAMKPAWSALISLFWPRPHSRHCFPSEFRRALFIYYRLILIQFDLPGNPVGKLDNVVFGPRSFVRVGEVTLQSDKQTKHKTR